MTMTTTTTASQTWSPLGPTTAGWSPTPPRRTGTVSGLGPGLPSARLAVALLCPAPLPRQPPLVWPGEPWESPASSCQRRAPPWAETTRGREASRRPPLGLAHTFHQGPSRRERRPEQHRPGWGSQAPMPSGEVCTEPEGRWQSCEHGGELARACPCQVCKFKF